MKTLIVAFYLSVLSVVVQARVEEVIPGEVFYDVPEWFSGSGPSSTDLVVTRKFLAKGNAYENHRQLGFGILMPGGDGKEDDVMELAVLKGKLEKRLHQPHVKNLSEIGETVMGGRKALKVSYEVTNGDSPAKTVFAFETYWIPARGNRVIQLSLSATPASQLESIRETLKTLVVKDLPPKDPIAPLAVVKDKTALGAERSQIYQDCGKPLAAGPSYDVYYLEPYFTTVDYTMPNVECISYRRSSDAKKLAKAYEKSDGTARGGLPVPLTPEDVKTLLDRHGPGPEAWKPAGENRWERADGAVAFHWMRGNALIIATKEGWTRRKFE